MDFVFSHIDYSVKPSNSKGLGQVWSKASTSISNTLTRRKSIIELHKSSWERRDEELRALEREREVGSPHEGMTRILRNVNGHFLPGQLVGVLGPSGSGKSSLLDVMAGRKKSGLLTGHVFMDGQDLEQPDVMQLFKMRTSYVMQDDVFYGNLTVKETLRFALQLRTPDNFSKEEEEKTINDLIQILNLEKVADSRIGTVEKRGISGGERRRLSIGVEMVTYPQVLFCDEITSGLDAQNALRTMRAAKALCQTGRHTIICSIHQPRSSIFHMFDQILLLNEGRVIYGGPGRLDVLKYFDDAPLHMECPPYMNPADWLMDLLEPETGEVENTLQNGESEMAEKRGYSPVDVLPKGESLAPVALPLPRSSEELQSLPKGMDSSQASFDQEQEVRQIATDNPFAHNVKSPMELAETYRTSVIFQQLTKEISEYPKDMPTQHVMLKGKPSWFGQFLILCKRQFTQTIRDPGIIYIRTFAALAMAVLVGLVFFRQPDDASSIGNRVNSLLFLMCVFSLFCLPAISKLIEDRLLFQRERASGTVCTSAHYLSAQVVEIPVLIVVVLLYGCISYWMVGLNPAPGAFGFFLLTIFLVILVNFSVAQCVAALATQHIYALAGFMLVLVFSLLLGGFMISPSQLPPQAQWVVWLSYFFPGYSALMINEFSGRVGADKVLNERGFDFSKWMLIGVLCAWFVGLRLLCYVFLRFLHREKR